MFVYIYIYITFFFFSFLTTLVKNKNFTLTSTCFLFFLILVFIGLRNGIGSDWGAYHEHYFFSWEEKNNAIFELGYNALSHLFYSIGIEFNYLVFFITFMASLPILKLSKNYKYGIIVIFLYYTVYLLPLMGLMRQMIAVSLCLLAAEKLYQKKNRQYFVYVVTAMFFHVGAIIFFLAYFVQKIKINIQKVIFILIILSIFNYFIIEQLGYYLIYADIMYHEVRVYFSLPDHNPSPPYYPSNLLHTMAMFAQKILFLITFLYYFTKISYSHRGVFYLKIYSLSLMLSVMFYFSIPVLATRGSSYFSIVEILLLVLLCEHTKYKQLFIFLILLYGGIKYFKIIFEIYQQIIPYQSIFSI